MNPYETKVTLSTDRFLETTYILMRKKVTRLIEIEKGKKGNISLDSTKEKFEITSNILSAILTLTKDIDFTTQEGNELAGVLNDLGLLIGKGNIGKNKEEALKNYNIALVILNAFLETPNF